MKRLVLVIVAGLTVLHCDDGPTGGPRTPSLLPPGGCPIAQYQGQTYDSLAAQLECLWSEGDTVGLVAWFNTWAALRPPYEAPASTLPSRMLTAVHNVFAAVYTPHDLSALGMFEWGSDFYVDDRFALVQQQLVYCVLPDSLFDTTYFGLSYPPDSEFVSIDAITDFRPPLPDLPCGVVYLDGPHGMAIDSFILADKVPVDSPWAWMPFQEGPTVADRAAFLSAVTTIMHEHWTVGYMIETGPVVSRMVFNESLDRAYADFSLIYQGGFYYLSAQGGEWVVDVARLTWITKRRAGGA